MESKEIGKETSQENKLASDTQEWDVSSANESTHGEKGHVTGKSFGVRRSELVMEQLDSWWLKGLFFFFIFVSVYVGLMESTALGVFTGYATNSYNQHSLMSTIGVIVSVMTAASLPFYARLSDTFGRLELFVVAIVFRIVGLVIQSQATDIQKYAAGSVLYGFGVPGMRVLWNINISDASALKWRVAAIGVLSMTQIITTWSSGEIVDLVLSRYDWKYGIAMWAFILPLACLPYFLLYLYLTIKASRGEAWKQINQEDRAEFHTRYPRAKLYDDEIKASTTFFGRMKGHLKYAGVRIVDALHVIFWKVDFIGCLLIVVIFGLILVPLTLAGGPGKHERWKRASTIVPLVLGFCSIPLFVVWEMKITRTPMLPFVVMKNRGVWAAFLVGIFSTLIITLPNSYAYPVLLVGMNATPTVATRTGQLGSFVEGVTMPILGYILSRVRRTKGFVLFGNCVMFIAMGLFVHFRGSNDGIRGKYFRDGIAASMCISGFASLFFTRVVFASVQSCTNHEYMATVTALFAAFFQIGGAIGRSITGAIWTQEMYQTIVDKMAKVGVDTSLATSAYESPYTFVQTYPWGSDPRRAMSMAYAEVQRYLCITGLCLCVPMLVWVLLLRDHRLSDAQNLEDEAAINGSASDAGQQGKSQVTFTNDKDYILDFAKRLIGRK